MWGFAKESGINTNLSILTNKNPSNLHEQRKKSCTLGPAGNEFGYNEHPPKMSIQIICIRIININP